MVCVYVLAQNRQVLENQASRNTVNIVFLVLNVLCTVLNNCELNTNSSGSFNCLVSVR